MTPQLAPPGPGERVSYVIDRHDVILSVGDDWDRFAASNGAVELLAGIVGVPLWNFVTGLTTRHVYRQLVSRARDGQVVSFAYRCDSPALRRFMRMTITPREDGCVSFESVVERTEPRPPVMHLDSVADEADPGLRMCSWCKRIDVLGSWEEVEIAVERLGLLSLPEPPLITHAVCPACVERLTEDSASA
jgi:hypothetical protein